PAWRCRAAKLGMSNMPDYTDNARVSPNVNGDAFPDRVPAGKISLRQHAINNDDSLRVGAVLLGEIAPLKQRYSQGAQVLGPGPVQEHARRFPNSCGLVGSDPKRRKVVRLAQWNHVRRVDGINSGKAPDVPEETLVRASDLSGGTGFRGREAN